MLQILTASDPRPELFEYEYEYRRWLRTSKKGLMASIASQCLSTQSKIRREQNQKAIARDLLRSYLLRPSPFTHSLPSPFEKGERVGGEGQKRISLQLLR